MEGSITLFYKTIKHSLTRLTKSSITQSDLMKSKKTRSNSKSERQACHQSIKDQAHHLPIKLNKWRTARILIWIIQDRLLVFHNCMEIMEGNTIHLSKRIGSLQWIHFIRSCLTSIQSRLFRIRIEEMVDSFTGGTAWMISPDLLY